MKTKTQHTPTPEEIKKVLDDRKARLEAEGWVKIKVEPCR